MKLQARPYQVLGPTGLVLGQVKARNALNAATQARQMFGPWCTVKSVQPEKATKSTKPATPTVKEPVNPAWGPGQKAAFTKQLLALCDEESSAKPGTFGAINVNGAINGAAVGMPF